MLLSDGNYNINIYFFKSTSCLSLLSSKAVYLRTALHGEDPAMSRVHTFMALCAWLCISPLVLGLMLVSRRPCPTSCTKPSIKTS